MRFHLPMFDRLRFPAITFFGISFLGLLQVYYLAGGNGLRLSLSALGYGIALGFIIQTLFRQSLPKLRIGAASFCGAFMLWSPVVVVTYGFALMATPVLIVYAAAVVLGALAALSLRRPKAPEEPPNRSFKRTPDGAA